jgi:hypothetical protein
VPPRPAERRRVIRRSRRRHPCRRSPLDHRHDGSFQAPARGALITTRVGHVRRVRHESSRSSTPPPNDHRRLSPTPGSALRVVPSPAPRTGAATAG